MLEKVEQGSHINILNVSGKLVNSVEAIQGQNELDLGELFNGVYLLTAPVY